MAQKKRAVIVDSTANIGEELFNHPQSNYKRLMGKFFTETEEQVERLKRPANIYQYNAQ